MRNYYSGILIFRTSKGNENHGSKNRRVREIGGKLQCLTEVGKQLLVRVIGKFEKMRVREIGIPRYSHTNFDKKSNCKQYSRNEDG